MRRSKLAMTAIGNGRASVPETATEGLLRNEFTNEFSKAFARVSHPAFSSNECKGRKNSRT